jgi:hypothetical protein
MATNLLDARLEEVLIPSPEVSQSLMRASSAEFPRPNACFLTILLLLIFGALPARADDFDRLEGAPFFGLIGRPDARSHSTVTSRQAEALPAVLSGERAAFLTVRTDQGHLAKLLVSFAFRKRSPALKEASLAPVAVLERYATLDSGDRTSIKARGREVVLFDGFRFDLDSGQVVPDGFGADVVFVSDGAAGPRLVALGQNRIYTVDQALSVVARSSSRPSAGRAVAPEDFAGRYRLLANGQWSGGLELTVTAGTVSGRFRSDRNGAAYSISGRVAAASPGRIMFTIQFPRAVQSYEGLLWTEGKDAFAGTMVMLERRFSFVAIREGSALDPTGIAWEVVAAKSKVGHRKVVQLMAEPDRYLDEGRVRSPAELAKALSEALQADSATSVLLVVPSAIPFDRVIEAASIVEGAGIKSISLAPAAGAPVHE